MTYFKGMPSKGRHQHSFQFLIPDKCIPLLCYGKVTTGMYKQGILIQISSGKRYTRKVRVGTKT